MTQTHLVDQHHSSPCTCSLIENLLAQAQETNLLLIQVLDTLQSTNLVATSLLQKANSGIRIQEPLLVEVDGIVSVVGN